MKNLKNIPQLTEIGYRKEYTYATDRQLYANHSIGSDRYPYEIVEIISERKILVREMTAIPDPEAEYDYYSNQVWKFESNPNGKTFAVTKRKDGYWYQEGDGRYCPFHLDIEPNKYRDPHF